MIAVRLRMPAPGAGFLLAPAETISHREGRFLSPPGIPGTSGLNSKSEGAVIVQRTGTECEMYLHS